MRGSIFDVGGMLMDGKTYFLVAGTIFTLVAVFHLLRVFEDWPVMIADWSAPKWVSWIALIVGGGLAIFGFRFTANDED
jgi:hypothetical protein